MKIWQFDISTKTTIDMNEKQFFEFQFQFLNYVLFWYNLKMLSEIILKLV